MVLVIRGGDISDILLYTQYYLDDLEEKRLSVAEPFDDKTVLYVRIRFTVIVKYF